MKITKAARKEIKKFEAKQWPKANIEHYGHPVDYGEKEFLFKAVENQEIVGVISGKHEGGIVYVEYLIVDYNQRKRGIGRQLMQKAEEFGKKLGAHKAHLITGKDWQATLFYESLGYQRVAVLPEHHFKKDFFIYEKKI